MINWFLMNGYAVYIWPAYGIVFFVLTLNLLLIKRQRRRTRKMLQQWFTRQNNDSST